METACAQIERWLKEGLSPVPLAVDVFPRRVVRRDLGSVVGRLLGSHRIDPALLELETTDAALMGDYEAAENLLDELHALGVRCSLDCFGAGYSSIRILSRFRLHALTIDRAFIQDPPEKEDKAVSAAVISLAHSLGFRAIADGMETNAQLTYLAQRGCDEA